MSRLRVPAPVRRLVAERGRSRCEYCLLPAAFSPSAYCIEHIVPAIAGGTSDPKNLAFACAGCNGYKADKVEGVDPITNRRHRLFHPRKDRWGRHFKWSSDALMIEANTGVGRATIAALRLNRATLVNLRRVLILDGVHPPMD